MCFFICWFKMKCNLKHEMYLKKCNLKKGFTNIFLIKEINTKKIPGSFKKIFKTHVEKFIK